jgi:hypothetical protein
MLLGGGQTLAKQVWLDQVALATSYDAKFTSNPSLQYDEAKKKTSYKLIKIKFKNSFLCIV